LYETIFCNYDFLPHKIIITGKANWIGHILRRNCCLKHVTEGKIDGRIEVRGDGKEDASNLKKREDTGN
jgi:hypothetical protein